MSLMDLNGWLSAKFNDDHYLKSETSSSEEIANIAKFLSSTISSIYEDLEYNKVSYSTFTFYKGQVTDTSSALSTKIDIDSNWHLSSQALNEANDTLDLNNRYVHVAKIDNGMVSANFKIAQKSLKGSSREFILVVDNSANKQDIGLRLSSAILSVTPKFIGSSDALDVIKSKTSCLIDFKEVAENTFFVKRSQSLTTTIPKQVVLYSFLSGCIDTNNTLIPNAPSYTKHNNKPFTVFSIGEAPTIAGYAFQRYYGGFAGGARAEYSAGDSVVLTANFYLSAQYQSGAFAYINFYDPNNKLVISYVLSNGKIISPIDPDTGSPYTKVDYPVLINTKYDIKWNSEIPELTSVVGTYSIRSTWVEKSVIDIEVDDDDEGFVIVDEDGKEIEVPDDMLSGFIFAASYETDDEVGIIATSTTEMTEDGLPATLIAVMMPEVD